MRIDADCHAWRFYTVPGDPAKGFENEAMRKAAATWSGQWWKLEQALHSLLDSYRINRSREFFTDHCLPHIDSILAIHDGIQRQTNH